MATRSRKQTNQQTEPEVESPFSITTNEKTNKEEFTLNANFRTMLVKEATSLGEAILNRDKLVADRLELVRNFGQSFATWKAKFAIGTQGLPYFVHTFLDSTCPETYGKTDKFKGPDNIRKKINSHSIFQACETMRKAYAKIQQFGTLKTKLLESVGAEDGAELTAEEFQAASKKYSKDARADNAEKFRNNVKNGFSIVVKGLISSKGLTSNDVEKALGAFYPNLLDKETGAIKKASRDLISQVMEAVFAALGGTIKVTQPPAPAPAASLPAQVTN